MSIERVRTGLYLGRPGIDVVGAGAAGRDDLAADLRVRGDQELSMAVGLRQLLGNVLGSPTTWPSYPITPRTARPLDRARSASRACIAGRQPHREPDVDVDQDLASRRRWRPPRWSPAESTATVMRASRWAPSRRASTRLVREEQVLTEPGLAMPLHLAHGRAAERDVAGRRLPAASGVHLWAFTCGLSLGPGSAALIARRLCSNAAASTSSAGVVRSAEVQRYTRRIG